MGNFYIFQQTLSNGRYTTGGYFTTEDLNGNVIDFIIPHNNVIKVNGDITLEYYEGQSLYILASGKVTLGNVIINNPEDNQSITQDISDGKNGTQTVTINSKNDVKILDVRSGIDTNKLPNILEDNPSLPSGVNATFNPPTSADIIAIDYDKFNEYGFFMGTYIINSGGNVLLTNQYKPNYNLGLNSGNIKVGEIYTSTFDEKNGGAIAISTMSGNISTQSLNSSSNSNYGKSGNGGNITISTMSGNISTPDLNSSSKSSLENSGNGGNITLITSEGNLITTVLNSISSSYNGNSGNGGNITLITSRGNLTTDTLYSYSDSSLGNSGNGGNIIISAMSGNISTQYLHSYSISSLGTSGNGGNITLNITEGNISTQNLSTFSSSLSGNSGNGGNIKLSSMGGNMATQTLDTYSYSPNGNAKNGGNIDLSNKGGNISTQYLNSYSFSPNGNAENGGNINLTISSGNLTTQSLFTSSRSSTGNAKNGGNINLTISLGNLTTQSVNSFSISDSGNSGNGGNITLKTSESNIFIPYITSSAKGQGGNGGKILLMGDKLDINNIVINSDGQNGSNGGLIKLESPLIQLTNSDLSSSSYGSGNSGQIELNSTGNINLNNSRLFTTLEPGSTGNGGNIQIQTKQNLNLSNFSLINTGTYSIGNAGNININAENLSLKDGSSLQSLTVDQGNAGNIFLNVINGNISLNNSSSISTSATKTASGNSGNITLDSSRLSILNGSQIQALTEGIGTSKAGEIIIKTRDHIMIGGVDPNFVNPDKNALPGTNVSKRDSDYQDDLNTGNQYIKYLGSNNSIATAQQIQISDFYLDNPHKTNPNIEYSTRVPYISIKATGDDKIHVYAIKVNPGTRAVFDIDNTGDNESGKYGTSDFKTFPAINTKLTLLDSQGKILASNDDNSHGLGNGGSNNSLTLQQDPYLRYTFTQGGIYYIQVSNFDDQGVPSSYNFYGSTIKNTSYDLQISLEPNLIQANTNNNGQPSGLFAYTTGAGKAGNINLNTSILTLENNGLISATTSGGEGGSININANKLNVNSGGQLLTTTSGNNAAGDINIQVKESINLNGKNTGFFANTAPNSTGNGGNIKIDPIIMNIENGAAIAVNSDGSGVGGNIFLQAVNLVLNNGNINAETVNSNGGGITLEIGNYLLLANNSKITSTAGTLQSGGNGGNIIINAPFIIGLSTNPNHQIIANAFTGKGGNILINTYGIFGTEYIDIQASSQSGPQGIVEINTPGIDPTSGLTKLSSVPIDLSGLIDNSCRGLLSDKNSFTVTGKGGITPDPTEPLTPDKIWQDWGFLPKNINQESALIPQNTLQKEKTNQPKEIREAQGFIKDDKGNIILTSQPLQVIANGVYLHPLDCERLRELNIK